MGTGSPAATGRRYLLIGIRCLGANRGIPDDVVGLMERSWWRWGAQTVCSRVRGSRVHRCAGEGHRASGGGGRKLKSSHKYGVLKPSDEDASLANEPNANGTQTVF